MKLRQRQPQSMRPEQKRHDELIFRLSFASTTSPYPFIDRLASNAGSRPTTDLWWCLEICSENCWCYSVALPHCQIEWSRWEHTEWYSVNLLRAMGFHKIRVSTVFNGIFLCRASADATRTKNVDRVVVQFNPFSCRDTDDMSRVKAKIACRPLCRALVQLLCFH